MAVKFKKFSKMRKLQIFSITVTLLLFIMTMLFIWALFIRNGGNDDAVQTNAGVSDDEPVVRTKAVIDKEETFYQFDGKKILMDGGSYGEIYLPVYENVPASTVDTDAIVTRNGYSFYTENGEIASIPGVDVSEFQGDIDWQQVKDAGIEFAIIRVGYRTYGDGEINFDKKFAENLEGAQAVGIKTGVYFFSQAITVDEAVAEADAVLDAIAPYKIDYPVVYDWELIHGDDARTDNLAVETLTDSCIAFCERVKSAGYTPMVYQNKGTTLFKLDLPRLTEYDFWLAEYGSKPTYYYDYEIWQYSNTGSVPGIAGDVDLNISFRNYGE